MGWTDWARYLNMMGTMEREDAARRVMAHMEDQPRQFSDIGTPKPTVADLLDYQTATGVEWPKRKLTVAEATRMNDAVTGGEPVAMNFPTEVIADWKPASQQAEEAADSAYQRKWAEKDRDYSELAKRAPEGVSVGQIARHVYGYPNTFEKPYEHESGALLQADSSGKVSSILGRAPETWGEEYTDESGAKLQRSSSGKISSFLGRPPASGPGASGQNTEYQRLRQAVARQWGYSEFSKIDDDTARKIEEATVLARQYYEQDPARNMDVAIARANQAVRDKYQAAETAPAADPQGWLGGGNEAETMTAIEQMRASGWGDADIQRILVERGWTDVQAAELISRSRTSRITPQMEQHYFQLRSQGLSPAEAMERLNH